MGSNTVLVGPEQLDELPTLLLQGKDAALLKPTNQYEAFRIRCGGGLAIGYKTGKIVVSGEECRAAVVKAIAQIGGKESGHDITIGSDEAGKGEWLGPMVVAAVALTPSQSMTLRGFGVMDSKALKLAKIAELAVEIAANSTSASTVLISPRKFNEQFAEIHKEGKNLNDLLAWAHAKAISEVYQHIQPDKHGLRVRVIIDEFSKLKTERRLSRVLELESIELIQRPRAEDDIAVASASILARNGREVWIDKESRRLGLDLRAIRAADALGRADCGSFAKLSYLKRPADG